MYTPDEALNLLLGGEIEQKPKSQFEKAIDLLTGDDYVEKAGKDINRLVKKQITNKEGQKQTVYIDPNKDKSNPKESKKQEDESDKKPKSIGSGTVPKGTTIIDNNGKKFHINEDKKLDFTEKNDDKVTFEVNGVKYHVDHSKVKESTVEGEGGTKVAGDKVHIDKREFVEDHKKLEDVLRNGSNAERGKEADERSKKLKEVQNTDKPEKEPKWYDELNSKNSLSRLPIGIPEDNVEINEGGHEGNWIMRWIDPKTQTMVTSYSKDFLKKNSKEKWKRIANVSSGDIKSIKDKTIMLLSDKDKDKAQSAAIISIIANTGLRPGSRKGFLKTLNRGVSTLSKENVKIKGDSISFEFTGKSYKHNTAEFKDPSLAKYLNKILKDKKDKDFIFDTDISTVRSVFKDEISPKKGTKLKDMRTYIATDMARQILFGDKSTPPPLPEKGAKKSIQSKLKNCFIKVSSQLNNSPNMAKTSYIHPNVINDWLDSLDSDQAETFLMKGVWDTFLKAETSSLEDIHDAEGEETDFEDADDNVDEYPLPDWWEEDENEEEPEQEDEEVNKAETDTDFEYKKHMHKSIGKTRDEMPQIDPEDIDSFLIHYSSKGTSIKKLDKKLSSLKPTQSDINDNKILKKIKSKSNWKDRKYIISLDGYLLDGHHDWATGLEFDPDHEVTCYRINLPIKKLISRTNRMNISYQKDIKDKKI